GTVLSKRSGRTGNVLLNRAILRTNEEAFNPLHHRGEDTEFFARMISRGHLFVWCDEAVAYEVVPSARWTHSFLLKKALLRGSLAQQDPCFGAREIAKSVIAVLAYVAALPITLILGQHRFMDLLVRLFDH